MGPRGDDLQFEHRARHASTSTATSTGKRRAAVRSRSASYHPNIRVGQNDWSPIGSEIDGKIDSLRISNIARVFTPLYPPSPGAPTPPGNLVPNGDFESGLMGWRLNGYGDMNLVWETTGGAATGQKCLHTLSTALTDYATAARRRQSTPRVSRGPFRRTPADNTRLAVA